MMAAKRVKKDAVQPQEKEIWNFPNSVADATVDESVKKRIRTEIDKNFLIEAVPGSGKTYNLVQRMLSLVLSGRSAKGIAAITFTRKAAEELRGRFREMMENTLASLSPEQKILVENGLLEIEDGYIGTIHGFCARLLRAYPVESHLDPNFIEIEEAEEMEFFRRTWFDLLETHPEFVSLFEEHDINPDESLIIQGIQKFCEYPDVDFSCRIKPPFPDPAGLLEAVSNAWKCLRQHDPRPVLQDSDNGTDAIIVKNWNKFDKLARKLTPLFARREFTPDDLKLVWRSLRYSGKLSLTYPDCDSDLLEQHAEAINTEVKAFISSYSLFIYPEFLPLLAKIRDTAQNMRNARGYVSYYDLLSLVVRLLKEKPDIRNALKQRFPYLLIDEFQDTDPLQAEMAFLLTANDVNEKNWLHAVPTPGSLFLVGDPKQSVYRFRRADINTYLKAAKRLEQTGGEVLSLLQNRRSFNSLCSWVDRAFKPVFDQQQGDQQAPFAKMSAMRQDTDGHAVRAFQLPGSIPGSATRQMADYDAGQFAEIIQSMLGKSFEGIKDGEPLLHDDFLILCRKKDLLVTYALALEEKGIPTNISGGGRELASALAREFTPLYWLLRALTECNNQAVVWAVLVGPVFGFSDGQIYDFCRRGNRLTCSYAPEAKTSVAKALRRMHSFRLMVQDYSSGAAFRKIVDSIGFAANLQTTEYGLLKTSFLLDLEKLFDRMPFSNAVQVLGNWLVHWPVDRNSDEPGRVRIMTMHKSKGLEAPVVILGGVGRPKFREPVAIIGSEELAGNQIKPGFLRLAFPFGDHQNRNLAVSPGWSDQLPLEEKADCAEKLRLDYVACTRARDLLLVSRHHNKKGGILTPLTSDLAHAVDCCPEFSALPSLEPDSQESPNEPPGDTPKEWRRRRHRWLKGSSTQEFAEESVTESCEKLEKKSVFSGKSHGGRRFGIFMHSLVCDMLRWRLKAGNTDLPRLDKLIDYCLREEPSMKSWRPLITTCAHNLLNSELWQDAGRATNQLTEVPISLLNRQAGNLPFSVAHDGKPAYLYGVIDLIIQLPEGWKIVDYKTNQVESEDHLHELNEFYRPQLDLYAAQWEEIIGEKVLYKSLFYLRTGKEIHLS